MQIPLFARTLGMVLAVAALASSCSNDNVVPFDPSRDAKLRIVHGSLAPGGEADFLIDGSRVTRLGYRETTAYITVAGGSRTIAMQDLPDQDGNPGPTFISAPVDLSPGVFHSVIVTGSGSEIAAFATTDGATPPAGNWSLRIVHAGQSTPSLDLYVTPEGADLNAATPLVSGIDWKEVSEYQVIGVARLQIHLTPTGSKTPLISSNPITFQDGQVSSMFVFDNPTPGNLPFGVFLADGGDLE
jgi:hypothetical protein